MEILLLVFGWLVTCAVIGVIDSDRKIGFGGSFFLSLFLSPIIGAIFIAPSPKNEAVQNNESSKSKVLLGDLSKMTKRCPDCAEEIKLEAIICRFCNYRFSEDDLLSTISEAKENARQQAESLDVQTMHKISRHKVMENPIPGDCEVCGKKINWIDWQIGGVKRCKQHLEI